MCSVLTLHFGRYLLGPGVHSIKDCEHHNQALANIAQCFVPSRSTHALLPCLIIVSLIGIHLRRGHGSGKTDSHQV